MEKIRIKNIKDDYFEDFWRIYENSFPANERRFLGEQNEVLKDEDYFLHVVIKDNQVVGFLSFWDMEEFYFFEHFAIDERFRGLGYGKQVFSLFLKDRKNIVLEIEKINDHISQKRFEFYQKFGFIKNEHKHFQVEFRKKSKPLELILLSQKIFTFKEYKATYKKMYQKLTSCWI